ncbi:MAG: hypothetical protein IPJ61_00130 [Tessaracoccus sp.]|uniref:hypothetical protein n=1 Tax=Tessaracoccus sp. TaxID=1971211 RepID=UPI001ECF390B|nr:hypothetical protein [Tessaracoccus sp.]MBK7819506.1 hypothetical protein [Tessaracoccus sp.]
MSKAKKRFQDLPPAARTLLLLLGVADAVLRAYALLDIAKRPQEQVEGPKELWVPALSFVNSAGVLPLAYLKWGRKH